MVPEQDPAPPSPDASGSPPPDRIGPASSSGDILVSARQTARRMLRAWRVYSLRAEIRFVPSEAQRLFALTILVGGACGLAAVAFHLAIRAAEASLVDRAMAAPAPSWIAWTIVTPTVGALLCGALLQYVVPQARGSGIPQVKAAFALPGRGTRFRDSVGKFAIGVIQIGSGSSLGREGPTVQICAGIATLFGRFAGVSPKNLRRLLPVGAAAGIAAAFNAPIAAVTFTIEEIVGDLDKSVLSGVIVAAALSAVIERSVLGEHPVFQVPQGYGLRHASSLGLYALLGVAAAIVSIVFTDSLLGLRRRFGELKRIPPWARPGAGGLVTGVLAVIALYWLKSRGVTGGGYDTLSRALAGSLTVKVMLVLCAMKVAATVASYSSGGAGGIFAPALFIGGMLGGAFGALDVEAFGHEPDSVGAFALVGMGAAFSGIVRAPMTSVLIIVEMTNGYSLILPLMIANMTAYGLARHVRPTPIYDALLDQDGVQLQDKGVRDALESIHLDRVVVRDGPLVTFAQTLRAGELLGRVGAQEVYPVLQASGEMVGIITGDELDILSDPDLSLIVNAADIMRPPVSVKVDDDLHTALDVMLKNGIRQLPVVDGKGLVIGFVDEETIAKAYLRRQTSPT